MRQGTLSYILLFKRYRYFRHYTTDELFPKTQSRIRRGGGQNKVPKRHHFVIRLSSFIHNVLDHFFIIAHVSVNVAVLNYIFNTRKAWQIM